MSFEKFFDPQSIAVVGASREPGKVGYEILKNLVRGGYAGKIFPVNPKADEIEGVKCFADIASIGQTPDLVVIVVPAKFVQVVMQQCVDAGTKAVIIITAGFKETGEEGAKLEKAVVALARSAGIRIVGPNCLGVMVPKTKLNASFGGDLPAHGRIGYMSQSGALLAAILDIANANDMGFSKLISIGNKADVDELDLVEALGDDPDTMVIAGYLENITKGEAFVEKSERISRGKPILLMKSGGTGAGAKAASSHTGSLAGSDTAYECAFARAGIIRCNSIKTQFDFAQAFSNQPLPRGSRVAVVTNAGGAGIMAADAVEREGLVFARPEDATVAKLKGKLPAAANFHNPFDVLGDALADRYEFAMNTVMEDKNVDIVLVLLTPQAMTESEKTAEAVVRVAGARRGKPVLTCFLGAGKIAEAAGILRRGRIPQYDSPEAAVAAVKAMVGYSNWLARPEREIAKLAVDRNKAGQIIDEHLKQGLREIGEVQAKEILQAYGFGIPAGEIVDSASRAVKAADRIGYPIVMKIWSPDIIHKSDVGGVRVNLGTPQAVKEAYALMMSSVAKKVPDARIEGVVIQQMCSKGQEVIIGMKRDPRFGPMIMFGIGGTMVEVMKDVAFRLAPLTEQEAREMMTSIRAYRILEGVRGNAGVDTEAIVAGLQRASQLVTDFPQIQEMDINPFVVGPLGSPAVAVDARMSVEETDS